MAAKVSLLGGRGRRRRSETFLLCSLAALASGCLTVHRDRPAVLVDTHPFVTSAEARSFEETGTEAPPERVVDGEVLPPEYVVSDRATVFCVDEVRDGVGFGDGEDEDRVEAFGALIQTVCSRSVSTSSSRSP